MCGAQVASVLATSIIKGLKKTNRNGGICDGTTYICLDLLAFLVSGNLLFRFVPSIQDPPRKKKWENIAAS